jgi:uncharacterized membrane protein
MPAKKKSPNHSTRETKKAIVMNTGKKNPTPIVIAVAVLIAAIAGLSLFWFPSGEKSPATLASAPPATATAEDGQITYAVSLFDDGKARHFDFADVDSNTAIKYFILKSTDGVIRAAFDACDVCWPEGKGYVQNGTSMVCRNCGRRFESVMVNEVQGGCNPAPLRRAIQGDRVVIRTEDLKKGQTYFNFSKAA